MLRSLAVVSCFAVAAMAARADECIECHTKITPRVVTDWQLSTHSPDVGCAECHGSEHKGMDDAAKTGIATMDVCAECHEDRVEQFKRGKHALGWAVMKAMPTIHHQPSAQIEGMKGCGACHQVGIKSDADLKAIKASGSGYGASSCDTCHTRHLFSVKEARQPQACQTCHMGFDHPQWEMYSSSKHGVRYLLKQNGVLPEGAAAPTCQTCHMQDGDHEVRTGWGFLAVRLPLPEDKQWAADQTLILQALGVLDPEGKPTDRLEVVKATDLARLTQEAFDTERNKMLKVCSECHSDNFAKGELAKGDDMIREADRLLAQAIQIIADLYKEGVLAKPANYAYPFPDLLTFHDAPTVIEQTLFEMHLKHRMRAFQGAFHANPDYSMWYGWSAMQRDLTEIKEMAATLRGNHKGHKHHGHDHEDHDHNGHDHDGHGHEGDPHEGHDHDGHNHDGDPHKH